MTLQEGLVSYYKFDENTGTSVGDSVGTNTGTWNGTLGSQWTTGKINSGGNFNGTDNNITIPDSSGNNFTTGTWTLWFKTSSAGTGNGSNLILKTDAFQSGNGMNVYLVSSKINYQLKAGTGQIAAFTTTGTYNDNNWHFLAMPFTNNGTILFYIDGILLNTQTMSSSFTYGAVNMELGWSPDAFWSPFTGVLDEIALWTRILTESEVKQLYYNGAGLQYPFDLNSPENQYRFGRVGDGMSRSESWT